MFLGRTRMRRGNVISNLEDDNRIGAWIRVRKIIKEKRELIFFFGKLPGSGEKDPVEDGK